MPGGNLSSLREFRFTAWTKARRRQDDVEVPRGVTVEADVWLQLRGAELRPADPAWWAGETEEPDWSQGAQFVDPRTGKPIAGTNMEGRPPDFMVEAWRSGRRTFDGVIIATTTLKRSK